MAAVNGQLWLKGEELKLAVNQATIEDDDRCKERDELFSCIVCRCLVFEPMRCMRTKKNTMSPMSSKETMRDALSSQLEGGVALNETSLLSKRGMKDSSWNM